MYDCKTMSLHLLVLRIQKSENERVVPEGCARIYCRSKYTLPEWRIHFPVFECGGLVHVKTLFYYNVVPGKVVHILPGTLGPRVKVPAAAHRVVQQYAASTPPRDRAVRAFPQANTKLLCINNYVSGWAQLSSAWLGLARLHS